MYDQAVVNSGQQTPYDSLLENLRLFFRIVDCSIYVPTVSRYLHQIQARLYSQQQVTSISKLKRIPNPIGTVYAAVPLNISALMRVACKF